MCTSPVSRALQMWTGASMRSIGVHAPLSVAVLPCSVSCPEWRSLLHTRVRQRDLLRRTHAAPAPPSPPARRLRATLTHAISLVFTPRHALCACRHRAAPHCVCPARRRRRQTATGGGWSDRFPHALGLASQRISPHSQVCVCRLARTVHDSPHTNNNTHKGNTVRERC
jgi:hypothetical protein